MSDAYVWLAYLATYGIMAGYALATAGRMRRARRRR